jgi:hypothetical protein
MYAVYLNKERLLTEQSVPTKLTYGDIWDGQHFTFGFSRMFRKENTYSVTS